VFCFGNPQIFLTIAAAQRNPLGVDLVDLPAIERIAHTQRENGGTRSPDECKLIIVAEDNSDKLELVEIAKHDLRLRRCWRWWRRRKWVGLAIGIEKRAIGDCRVGRKRMRLANFDDGRRFDF